MAYSGFISLGKNRYASAVKTLRQVVDKKFDTDTYDIRKINEWTPAMKKQVRRYFREYDHLTARPYEIIRKQDHKQLIAVQKAAYHQKYLGKFKVAFVPTDGVHKPIIKIDKKNQVTIKIGQITKRLIPVNAIDLATDPIGTAEAVIAATPGAKSYRIQCGQYEFTQVTFHAASTLGTQIQKMQNKYQNWHDWLNGIVAYYYENRKSLVDFTVHLAQEREKLHKKRRNKRETIKRREQKEYYDNLFEKRYGKINRNK